VFERRWVEIVLAVVGVCLAVGLLAWEYVLLDGPTDNVLTRNRHLAVYWVEDRWRWPLMFAAGAVGVAGVVRLARRGRPLPLVWAGGCFLLGLVGLAGAPVPVWWRFVLLAQVPLAIGVVLVLTETRSRAVRILVATTFALCLAVKAYTLFGMTDQYTYYGTKLQPVWNVGKVIPPGEGSIASDPFTSYYLPAVTGRPVLTVTKAHVGSPSELRGSERGYETLHQFAVWDSYPGWDWWQGAKALWDSGVRWVVVEHSTSLRPATLEQFSTGPTPLVRTDRDRRLLGRYMWRLNRIGRLEHDDGTYAIWRLKGAVINGVQTPSDGGTSVAAGALSHAR
jgi:hypothetical protein